MLARRRCQDQDTDMRPRLPQSLPPVFDWFKKLRILGTVMPNLRTQFGSDVHVRMIRLMHSSACSEAARGLSS
jgi:hypothetical protein